MNHFTKLSILAALSTVASTAAFAQAEDSFCGKDYTIVSGDTLSSIASRAFGESSEFLRFYDIPANAEVLGSDPNKIRAGATIQLPSCDGAAEVVAEVAKPVNLAKASVEALTGSNNYPFTGQELNEGGMVTQIVMESFNSSDLDSQINVDYIDDWNSHLSTLLPKGAYDLSFPWFKPQCENGSALSQESQDLCKLVWSESVFSVALGFYIPEGLENPPFSFSDFKGETICRPAGNLLFDLENNGLINGESITLVQPATAKECFKMLEEGKVFAVSTNRFAAGIAIAELGLQDFIIPSGVVGTQTMHVVAEPDNEDAVGYINALNEGLSKLKESGRYSQIIRDRFAAHDESVDAIVPN